MARSSNSTRKSVTNLDIALKDLGRLLDTRSPATAASLAKWKRGVGNNIGVLNSFVYGTIRWQRRLGRPQTSALHEGFSVDAWSWDEVLEYTPRGPVVRRLRVPHAVSLWDGRSDAKTWRVNFLVSGLHSDRESYVNPRILEGVAWNVRNSISFGLSGFRAIEPHIFGFKRKDATFLPDFEVVIKGFAEI